VFYDLIRAQVTVVKRNVAEDFAQTFKHAGVQVER
jgi:hypothetical protein